MKNFLPLFFLFIGLSTFGYSQGADYKPDLSMDPAAFQKQALQPKEEIWVLDFWASWCGPCIEAAPHIKDVQARYAPKGVRFISLSWDESLDRWMSAVMRLRMPWQQLVITKELKGFIDKEFPHRGIPAAFVVRRDGKIKRVNGVGMLETTIKRALAAN